jgi:hypothetical protein
MRTLIRTLALVGGTLWVLSACSANLPFDNPVIPPAPINGQITVTTVSGSTVMGGVTITVSAPNGSTKTAVTASIAGPGIIVGQVQVPEPRAGTYKIMLPNQPASSPFYSTVNLTPAQPYANVQLQLVGAGIGIVPADSLPQSYTGDPGVHSYTLTYYNTTAINDDLTLVTSNVPTGWTVNIPTTQLKVGQSTPVYIYNPAMSYVSPAAITINGYAGANPITATTITLAQNWGFGLQVNSTQSTCQVNGSGGCGNTWSNNIYTSAQLVITNVSAATLGNSTLAVQYTVDTATNTSCLPTMQVTNPCATSSKAVTLPYTVTVPNTGTTSNIYLGFDPAQPGNSVSYTGSFNVTLNGIILAWQRPVNVTLPATGGNPSQTFY